MSTYYVEVAVNQNTNIIEVNTEGNPSVEVNLESNLHKIDVVDQATTSSVEVNLESNLHNIDVVDKTTAPYVEVNLGSNLHNIDIVDKTIAITNTNKPIGTIPYAETTIVTGDYSIDMLDDVVIVMDSGVTTPVGHHIIITLLEAIGNLGKIIRVKNKTMGSVKVVARNNETIDDLNEYNLFYKHESITLLCDGSNWCII